MMRRLRTGSLGLLLAMALAPAQAAAQPAEVIAFEALNKKQKKKRMKKAKRYDKRGKKAYKKKAWDDAIVSFELAYEAVPEPRYLFNIGRAYEKKGDLFKSMDFTQRYVQQTPVGEEREEAADLIEVLKSKLLKTSGVIEIATVPAGATVRLTGRDQEITSVTPMRRWLPTGAWEIEISHSAYPPQTLTRSIALGQTTTLEIPLETPKCAHGKDLSQCQKCAAPKENPTPPILASTPPPKEPTPPPADTTGTAAATPKAGGPGRWPLIAWSAGAALAAGGVAMGLAAQKQEQEYRDLEGTAVAFAALNEKHEDAQASAQLATMLYAGAGAAALAGAVLWLLDDEAGGGHTAVDLQLLPHGLALSFHY